MNRDQFINARQQYGYVNARLVAADEGGAADLAWDGLRLKMDIPLHSEWHDPAFKTTRSSIELDDFHNQLLSGGNGDGCDDDLLHGLLSVVFWGYASGTDGRINQRFALSRTRRLQTGRGGKRPALPQSKSEILTHLRAARDCALEGRMGEALLNAMQLKFIYMAFASKLVMFINPGHAAVYDDVIGNRLSGHPDAEMRQMGLDLSRAVTKRSRAKQAAVYQDWCNWCASKAKALNENSTWTDWNGSKHAWRAVDVERAFFSLGRE